MASRGNTDTFCVSLDLKEPGWVINNKGVAAKGVYSGTVPVWLAYHLLGNKMTFPYHTYDNHTVPRRGSRPRRSHKRCSVHGDCPPVRKGSLPLFKVVVHDVPCRQLLVLRLRGPGVMFLGGIVWKAYISARGGRVSEVPPVINLTFVFHRGWFPVVGWYLRYGWYRT